MFENESAKVKFFHLPFSTFPITGKFSLKNSDVLRGLLIRYKFNSFDIEKIWPA